MVLGMYSPMNWDPYFYFQTFESMVNNVFIWILIGFVAINVGAIIFCAIKNKGDKEGFLRDLGIAVWLNILGLIAIFAICCVVYSSGVYFKNGNYTLTDNYYNGWRMNTVVLIITSVVAAAVGIAVVVLTFGSIGFWSLAVGLLAGGLTWAAVHFGIGFIVYVIIWAVWLIIRLIYVMISTFGLSIFKFATTHWLPLVLTIGVPAVITGLISAGVGYVKSLREEVYVLTTGTPKFTGVAQRTVTASAKKEDTIKVAADDEIVVKEEAPKATASKSTTTKSSASTKSTSSTKSSTSTSSKKSSTKGKSLDELSAKEKAAKEAAIKEQLMNEILNETDSNSEDDIIITDE